MTTATAFKIVTPTAVKPNARRTIIAANTEAAVRKWVNTYFRQRPTVSVLISRADRAYAAVTPAKGDSFCIDAGPQTVN